MVELLDLQHKVDDPELDEDSGHDELNMTKLMLE